jgi:hypothetical protein
MLRAPVQDGATFAGGRWSRSVPQRTKQAKRPLPAIRGRKSRLRQLGGKSSVNP